MMDCRNKGIAPKVVKLLARTYYLKNEIEYFLIRISSKNLHSKYVFEKLGVTFWEEEKGQFEFFMDSFKGIMEGYEIGDIEESCRKLFGEDEGEVIYKYKYLPEVFLC